MGFPKLDYAATLNEELLFLLGQFVQRAQFD